MSSARPLIRRIAINGKLDVRSAATLADDGENVEERNGIYPQMEKPSHAAFDPHPRDWDERWDEHDPSANW